MYDELEFIARVEAASVTELAQIMARPTAQQERTLRVHYGDARYERMHELALQQPSVSRGTARDRGNVVVIHGIMGGELSDATMPTSATLIWVNMWRIFRGWLARLQVGEDGRTGAFPIRASGIITDYYGEMLLKLRAQGWNVQPFWFDWRLDLSLAADQLNDKINEWFGKDSPVQIVAHSMGGLVARTFIQRYRERWRRMWDTGGNGRKGGRLVMLGTPNYGSFAVPQIITGLEPTVRKLALLDLPHGLNGVLKIINTFPGTLQMLPSPFVLERVAELYQAHTYGDIQVAQRHLDAARRHHELLRDVVDFDRMIYIAGYNQTTLSDLRDLTQVASRDAYELTRLGDGRVTHQLGIPKRDGQQLKTVYFIEEDHGELPRNLTILSALDELLVSGATNALSTSVPALRAVVKTAEKEALRRQFNAVQDTEVERFRETISQLGLTRSAQPPKILSGQERHVREELIRSLAGTQDEMSKERRQAMPNQEEQRKPPKPLRLEVRLLWAGIEEVGETVKPDRAIDAIAVGHYVGIGKPLHAEYALDKAISQALNKNQKVTGETAEKEHLLALYAERGIIRGELGQPFFLADPRSEDGRLVVVAGMGVPGRFGTPELTVLSRELCWSLGRLRKRHLATVLIGSGQGNLSVEETVRAWLRGARYALTGSAHDNQWLLQRITFVEKDPFKIKDIQAAILAAQQAEQQALSESPYEQRLDIVYEEVDLSALVNPPETDAGSGAGLLAQTPREQHRGPSRPARTYEGHAGAGGQEIPLRRDHRDGLCAGARGPA